MGLVKANTPMMNQFNAIKADYPDCVLFFRAGDFYEMFGDDAVRASEILNIALTTRNKNSANAVAMCGIPYHAYEQYLNRLTAAGVKVAICEQMEEASQAKGVVRREVVRVVTPGTTLSSTLLEDDRNNYLMAMEPRVLGKPVGVAMVDLTTGQFEVMEFDREHPEALWGFLLREKPRELLLPGGRNEREQETLSLFRQELRERFRALNDSDLSLEEAPAAWFDTKTARGRLNDHFQTANLEGFGVESLEMGIRAAGALFTYLSETQKCDLAHISALFPRQLDQAMWLDESTLSHLEIFENHSPGGKKHTLFATLNQTCTPMGARMLRRWLSHPLVSREAIQARQDAIGELLDNPMATGQLRDLLARIGDLERTIGRVNLPVAGVADVVSLRDSLGAIGDFPELLADWHSPLMVDLAARFDSLPEIHDLLRKRIQDEPSLRLLEGGYIARGVDPELDRLWELATNSREVITSLEARERASTGISTLKIRYNKVFGYYLEISKTHQDKIPERYIRKQTLVNAERYTTHELEEVEEQILGAEEKIGRMEYEAFQEIRTILGGYARRMQATAALIATFDVLVALARCAAEYDYARPDILEDTEPRQCRIVGGRHPVLERIDLGEAFIPNDLQMDGPEQQILLITGPNMAGKSTVMRQVALIQLMAQIGSYVPARATALSMVDRIFTRVGASDNLSRGQSTFMMEMNEAANILHNATPNSLLILDEIGRGTSTYDGISIAWAMVEYLHKLGALTLFATHYHELTQLARELPRLRNYNIAIAEEGDRLIFPRKLQPGEADKSYGIQVARLAGLPESVVDRAHQVMRDLTNGSDGITISVETAEPVPSRASPEAAVRARQQLSFLAETHPVIEKIRELELDELSPREALDFLYKVRNQLKD